jgi:hypothetical protein
VTTAILNDRKGDPRTRATLPDCLFALHSAPVRRRVYVKQRRTLRQYRYLLRLDYEPTCTAVLLPLQPRRPDGINVTPLRELSSFGKPRKSPGESLEKPPRHHKAKHWKHEGE